MWTCRLKCYIGWFLNIIVFFAYPFNSLLYLCENFNKKQLECSVNLNLGIDGFRFDAVKHIYDINEIYKKCDYISVHVPLMDSTKNMINADAIAMMKEYYGAMLDKGATTFWETALGEADFDGAGSLCHGWSALAIYYYERLCE